MSKKTLAYIANIVQVAVVALSIIFVKIVLEMTKPVDQLTYRFFLAFLTVVVVNIFSKKKLKITKEMAKDLGILSIFFPVLFLLLQGLGLNYSTATETAIIQSLAPIFAIILSQIMLKEKTTTFQKFMILLSVAGIVYMTYMGSKSSVSFHLKGTILLLLSSVALAFNLVLPRAFRDKYTPYEITSVIIIFGFFAFAIQSLIYHLVIKEPFDFALMFQPKFFASMFYLGVLSIYMTSYFNNYALKYLEVSKMSVFTNLCPIISLIGAVVILKESVHYYHIVGIAITLIGIIGTNINFKTKK